MTTGTGLYSPGPRFSFSRSYIAEVANASAGFALSNIANSFTLDFRPTFASVYHWTFDARFWVWSSNVWTLDHIITESFYTNPPDPTQIPLDFTLYWARQLVDDKPKLFFAPNHSTVSPVITAIQAAPLSYWTRPT